MNYFQICHISSFYLIFIILIYIIQIHITTTTTIPFNKQSLLINKLSNIDNQIHHLTDKISLQFKHKFQPNYNQQNNINTKSTSIQNSLQKIYSKLPQFNLFNIKQSPQQIIQAKQICSIILKHNNINQSKFQNIKYNFYSSKGEYYIFVSNLQKVYVQIYGMNCQLLGRLNELTIKFVFEQQKSNININYNPSKQAIQHQLVYIISNKNELIVIDLIDIKKRGKQLLLFEIEQQSKQKQKQNVNKKQQKQHSSSSSNSKLYKLLNSKLILPNQQIQIIGVLIKTVNNPVTRTKQNRAINNPSNSYREKSLFVAYDTSQIKVFDQMGTQKISMKQPSIVNDFYQESIHYPNSLNQINDKSIQFIDLHPQPILVESNWIYFLDTSKYSRQTWSCPFIPKVIKLFVQNHHQSQVYVLTYDRIYKINVKPKDIRDQAKKGLCEIQRSIPYFDPFIEQKKPQDIVFSVHKNLIFLDNLIYNMTSNQYLTVQSSDSILNKATNKQRCNKFFIEPFPNIPTSSKKTPLQKHLSIILSCKTQTQTSLHLFTVTQIKSQSSLLVYIIVGFMMLIFFAIKCFKSSGSNYQKQLLYPLNFDAQQKQIRKEHYEQLKKYMDQARIVQQEEKKNKCDKNIQKQKKKQSKIKETKTKKQ